MYTPYAYVSVCWLCEKLNEHALKEQIHLIFSVQMNEQREEVEKKNKNYRSFFVLLLFFLLRLDARYYYISVISKGTLKKLVCVLCVFVVSCFVSFFRFLLLFLFNLIARISFNIQMHGEQVNGARIWYSLWNERQPCATANGKRIFIDIFFYIQHIFLWRALWEREKIFS